MPLRSFTCSIQSMIFIILTHQIILTIEENFKCVKDGFFPDKRDCWLYHICAGNSHSVKACKEDLLFNPLKNECDWAMNVNCSKNSTLRDALPEALEPPRPVSNRGSVLTESDTILIGKYPPGSIESIFDYLCRSVDNDYIAHPTDCKRYAYCANGIPQAKVCIKNLFWSQKEKMCVWPVQSDCPVKHVTAAPHDIFPSAFNGPGFMQLSTFPSAYVLTEPAPPLPSSNVYKPSIICPSSQSWRVPDPYDCSIYHDCYHGVDLISYCPAQLQYNSEKQACDHAINVQCKNKCTINNEGTHFVDPTSCCHYFQCVSGKLVAKSCTHPDLFDVRTRTCLPYKRVKCDGRRQCMSKCHYLSNYDVGKSLCEIVPSCGGNSDGFYPDRTKPNCQFFIQCLDNRVVNQSRCANGQRFNRNTGRCAAAEHVHCRSSHLLPHQLLFLSLVFLIIDRRTNGRIMYWS